MGRESLCITLHYVHVYYVYYVWVTITRAIFMASSRHRERTERMNDRFVRKSSRLRSSIEHERSSSNPITAKLVHVGIESNGVGKTPSCLIRLLFETTCNPLCILKRDSETFVELLRNARQEKYNKIHNVCIEL